MVDGLPLGKKEKTQVDTNRGFYIVCCVLCAVLLCAVLLLKTKRRFLPFLIK